MKWFAAVAAISITFLLLSRSTTAGQAILFPDLAERSGEDWPDFLGTDRDGKSNATGLEVDKSETTLKVCWSTEMGTGYAACSVSRGRCLVFDRVEHKARLRCLNAEDGRLIWTYEYVSDYEDMYGFDDGPRCSPVVDDNRVYVYGAEGELHCVNIVDGKRVWSCDLSDEYGVVSNFFGVGSTPLVFENLLLVMVGGSPPASHQVPPGQLDRVTPDGSCLVALDKLTGAEVYHSIMDLASYASLKLAPFEAGTRIVLFGRTGVWQVDSRNGEPKGFQAWRAKKLESVNASTPIVVDQRVFVTESYEPGSAVMLMQPESLDIIWKDDASGRNQAFASHWMTPIHHNGFLYGCSGQSPRQANLRCIEWDTGRVRWTKPGTGRVSLLYVDGHFISLSERGDLQLFAASPDAYQKRCDIRLETADGEKVQLDYPAWAAPVLRGDCCMSVARVS